MMIENLSRNDCLVILDNLSKLRNEFKIASENSIVLLRYPYNDGTTTIEFTNGMIKIYIFWNRDSQDDLVVLNLFIDSSLVINLKEPELLDFLKLIDSDDLEFCIKYGRDAHSQLEKLFYYINTLNQDSFVRNFFKSIVVDKGEYE